VFTVKKRYNFTQRFDLQGHARVQIFTYKDVSVCNMSSPNFNTFYDKRRVSTQISRLCHVHAQVHTLKDMSSHTFCIFFNSEHSAFAESETMETFHPGMFTYVRRVLVSQNGAESYRGQSLWSVVLRGQSFFVDGVYILWWLCTRIY